jgi:hypothetical protein
MHFPKTWEKFLKEYEFKDEKQVYTNGSMLVQSFRVEQMMEHYLRIAIKEEIKEFVARAAAESVLLPKEYGGLNAVIVPRLLQIAKEMGVEL